MGFSDLRIFQESSKPCSNVSIALVRAGLVEFGVKRHLRTHKSFDHQTSDNICVSQAIVELIHGTNRMREYELGTINQCQTCFGVQIDRLCALAR